MTFTRPFSGTFAYEGLIPSSAMNAINNAFPDILDKTGDTITGIIEIAAAGELSFLSGSYLETLSGSNVALAGAVTIESTATVISNANITLEEDANLILDSGSQLEIEAGALINFVGASNVSGLIGWTAASTSPEITQANTSGGTGQNFTIQAQGSTAGGGVGGTLYLSSGIGSTPGDVELQLAGNTELLLTPTLCAIFPAGSNGYAWTVNNWSGTINSQTGFNNIAPYFVSTSASGSNVLVASYTISNSTGMVIDINWVRRGLGGSGLLSNTIRLNAICNGAGSVSAAYETLYSISGSFANPSTDLSLAYPGSNTITITAVAQSSAADWQFVISLYQI